MNRFAQLFAEIDGTTKTSHKISALQGYLETAPKEDRLWCVAILSGRRPKRAVTTTQLRALAARAAGIPDWLFEDSYAVVGDLAETIALLLPPATHRDSRSLTQTIADLRALTDLPQDAREAAILHAWDGLDTTERLVFNKLLTGGFRIGVSQRLMTRALAQATGLDAADLAHRLMGDWTPDSLTWDALVAPEAGTDRSRPYPFALAHGVEGAPDTLGPRTEWQAEWKWDGIRGQIILRGGTLFLWSRGEELLTDRFPEFAALVHALPDGTVLDGEVLAWNGTAPLPFAALQKRIGRKSVPKRLLAEAPARFLAYDLLELHGKDMRDQPLTQRRAALEALLTPLPASLPIAAAPIVSAPDWAGLAAARASARDARAEGLMLKRCSAPYHVGRTRGDWWKWKLDPLTVDAVMIYAQAGHGRRANLFTDFTFAARDGNDLVPFAKAYSGLTDAEFRQITHWVRQNTQQRFGPVRQVPPVQVFELAFEGIQASPRHKSGIALRFPRILRWRKDKTPDQIDTLDHLKGLLAQYG